MLYGSMPLYPPMDGGCDRCVRMPLFGREPCRPPRSPCGCTRTVQMENPCAPGEFAEVTLSVDECGNLAICVHRETPRCGCSRPRRC